MCTKQALHALGRDLKDEEIKEMISKAGGSDSLDQGQFLKFMENMKDGTATKKEILDALEVFDKDKSGRIEAKELKKAMMSMGENPLSEREADELIRRGDPEAMMETTAWIEYKDFVPLMMKPIPAVKIED